MGEAQVKCPLEVLSCVGQQYSFPTVTEKISVEYGWAAVLSGANDQPAYEIVSGCYKRSIPT